MIIYNLDNNNGDNGGSNFWKWVKIIVVSYLIIMLIMYLIRSVYEYYNDNHHAKEITWINVEGKKGYAKVHSGMPKDSVLLLLGDPDKFSFGKNREVCSYKNGLSIVFYEGKLYEISK